MPGHWFTVKEVQNYLVDLGLVRAPNDEGDLPVIHILPKGTPEPGALFKGVEGTASDPVLAIYEEGGVPTARFAGHVDLPIIGIHMQHSEDKMVEAAILEKEIRRAFKDRLHFMMGGMLVQESQIFTPWQTLYGSEFDGYARTLSILLTIAERDYDKP